MDVKVGDVVHLRVRVVDLDGSCFSSQGDITVEDHSGQTFPTHRDCIVHVEPRPLKVGDRVKHKNSNDGGTKIIAIAGDDAWIEWSDGTHWTERLDNLERVS